MAKAVKFPTAKPKTLKFVPNSSGLANASMSRAASPDWLTAMKAEPRNQVTLPAGWGQTAFETAFEAASAPAQTPITFTATQPGSWGQTLWEAAKAASPKPLTFGQLAAGQGGWGGDAFQQALKGVQSGQAPIGQYYPQGGISPPDFSDWYRNYQQMGGGFGGGGGGGGGGGTPEMDWLRPWETFRGGQTYTQPNWLDWLEQMRPQLQRRYMGQLPPGAEVEPTTPGWEAWLAQQQAKLKQEWWQRPLYEKGMYPGRMAPPMRTIAGY